MEENETPKNRFESKMTRMMKLAISKIEDLQTDVQMNSQKLEKTNNKLDVLSGQFNDVGVMAIEDNKRITKLEGEVAELQKNIH